MLPGTGWFCCSHVGQSMDGRSCCGDYLVVLKTVRPRILPQPSGAGSTLFAKHLNFLGGWPFFVLLVWMVLYGFQLGLWLMKHFKHLLFLACLLTLLELCFTGQKFFIWMFGNIYILCVVWGLFGDQFKNLCPVEGHEDILLCFPLQSFRSVLSFTKFRFTIHLEWIFQDDRRQE